jgi:hypothetical protein
MKKNKDRLNREFRYCLRQCPALNDAERSLLSFVSSFSYGCAIPYEEICQHLSWSVSKLKRTVDSLEQKKLIEVKYRRYKQVTLLIAEASVQSAYAEKNSIKKSDDSSPMSHELRLTGEPMIAHPWAHDSSPMSQPIERDIKRDIKEDHFFENKKEGKDGWGNVATINSILANSRFGKKTRLEK